MEVTSGIIGLLILGGTTLAGAVVYIVRQEGAKNTDKAELKGQISVLNQEVGAQKWAIEHLTEEGIKLKDKLSTMDNAHGKMDEAIKNISKQGEQTIIAIKDIANKLDNFIQKNF